MTVWESHEILRHLLFDYVAKLVIVVLAVVAAVVGAVVILRRG